MLDLRLGDCIEVMRTLDSESVDAIVTDPPYELGFMGKKWDSSGIAYSVEMWTEALRVLKPGGHLLAFGGTRTYHRMACAIEDAGFEIRDCIQWLYGSGFPKSLDVSKAIDKAAGAEREVVGTNPNYRANKSNHNNAIMRPMSPGEAEVRTAPATPEAAAWDGWGTALKPANEPIVVARKPLHGTVAANVLAYGTGALNIDACRIGTAGGTRAVNFRRNDDHDGASTLGQTDNDIEQLDAGRWPANVVLDEEAAAILDAQSGDSVSASGGRSTGRNFGQDAGDTSVKDRPRTGHDYQGGASRFFYVAKPSRAEKQAGTRNRHATVKPVTLMRHLVRLVTPPGGTVLDPFMGSGTTGIAAIIEGFRFIGCELEDESARTAEERIRWWMALPDDEREPEIDESAEDYTQGTLI